MRNIVLVEDSEECQLVVRQALRKLEVAVKVLPTLKDARTYLASPERGKVDLFLLDLGLPDGDGISFLDSLQSDDAFRDVPVFLLTGREDLSSKVTAFSLGAEDYLVKPINPIELKARVEMRLRKAEAKKGIQDVLKKGDLLLELSLLRASVRRNGREEPLDLTGKEFKILALLAQNEGRVYSREQLMKQIWGAVHVLSRTVDSHVCGLRRKLGPLASYVECIPGAGYRFCLASPERSPSVSL